MQARFEPGTYGVSAYGTDVVGAVFSGLENPSRGQQTLQVAFLDNAEHIMKAPPSRNTMIGQLAGLLGLGNQNQMQILLATGGGTAFPGWVRLAFPPLAQRLEVAANYATEEVVHLHYLSLAARVRELAQLPVVQGADGRNGTTKGDRKGLADIEVE